MSTVFIDTNILVYALGTDAKASHARAVYERGGRISVQCLNEFASVAIGKLKMRWDEVELALADIRQRCGPPVAIDEALQISGLKLARAYTLSIYDGMIVAAALAADCDTLYSEDMHDGLVVDGRLRIVNPFASVA